MNPEEKLEMGRKLIAEAEAEIAAKKRNWPEEIRLGMVFSRVRPEDGRKVVYVVANLEGGSPELLGVIGTGGIRTIGDLNWLRRCRHEFDYLGMDSDVLSIKIADDAHEPTGAELVGKMCQFSDDGKNWTDGERPREQGDPRICIGYDEKSGHPYSNRWAEWKYARLAR